jgi:hypothetical protein
MIHQLLRPSPSTLARVHLGPAGQNRSYCEKNHQHEDTDHIYTPSVLFLFVILLNRYGFSVASSET